MLARQRMKEIEGLFEEHKKGKAFSEANKLITKKKAK